MVLRIGLGNDIRPSWPVEQLVHLIRHAEHVELKGAGHYMWLTHASELEALLKPYIKRMNPGC